MLLRLPYALVAVCVLPWAVPGCSAKRNPENPEPSRGGDASDPPASSGGTTSSEPSKPSGGTSHSPPSDSGAGTSHSVPSEAGAGASGSGGHSAADAGSGSDLPTQTGGTSAGGSGSEATGGSHTTPPEGSSGFLHVEGSKLVDDSGETVRLTGVNWFGLETSNLSPHGLWARDYRSMLKQIADLGFNSVRLPWCNLILRDGAEPKSVNDYGADPYDGTDPMNAPLVGKTPLEIMDAVIEAAGDVGLKIILDNHSRDHDGYMEEQVWYTDDVSEQQWIDDWRFLADRYLGNTTVVAFDLDNEPHGKATWAAGAEATDWDAAAERCGRAIQEVNPDVLIIVEGVEKVGDDTYWWGGNLSAARDRPIELDHPEKLVYSAHEYGPEVFQQPWFDSASFPSNLAAIWDSHYGYLMKDGLGHLFIGEFGIKDPEAYQGKSRIWFETLLTYIGPEYSWTFWCFNPNSGDTEGILEYDWLTPKQWKVDALQPYMAPLIE
jgi:endoglucanase